MINTQQIEEMLHIFKCVHCGARELKIVAGHSLNCGEYNFNTSGFTLHCDSCDSHYPITDDGIPVLWTPMIREILGNNSKDKGMSESLDNERGEKALSSNISNYDRISDDYSVNFRRDDLLARRIRTGANRLKNNKKNCLQDQQGLHLDIGCGPGHILEWLGDFEYRQIGLDVSLANLRNTRKATGAFVVLGDAAEMPFKNDLFTLVTASAVLHHIYDWKKTIRESCRVCNKQNGGIMFDSDPTTESLALSKLAEFVFDLRWYAYKLVSYIDKRKMHFRNVALAKNYYRTAEVHNQPGKGLSVIEFNQVLLDEGFAVDFYLSPNEELQQRIYIPWNEVDWKRTVLHLLSGHNPKNANLGSITALAVSNSEK